METALEAASVFASPLAAATAAVSVEVAANGVASVLAGVANLGTALKQGEGAEGQAESTGDSPAQGDYRGRFNESMASQGKPELPSEWDAHHRIPQEYREHPEFKGFDFDGPENIRGVSSSRNGFDVHQQITNEWSSFRQTTPNATRAQIEQFANGIDGKYGSTYWP